MGNICRSPMAEAVFRHLAVEAGVADRFDIDSAGTGSWHVGSPPHPKTQAELRANAVAVGDQRARQVTRADADADYVVAMDTDNLDDLAALFGDDAHAHLCLLLEHARDADERDVPDPYYAGGYDRVYELVADGCAGLLDFLTRREGLAPT
jgi:protein-tyrosine phosphatase